jgi:hypothetical protein
MMAAGFAVSLEEAKTIAKALESPDHMTIMQKSGVTLAGVHYTFLREGQGSFLVRHPPASHKLDPGHYVVGKKGESHTTQARLSWCPGLGGCYVSKTTKTLIVAVFEAPASLADCACDVEKLADYYVSMQM